MNVLLPHLFTKINVYFNVQMNIYMILRIINVFYNVMINNIKKKTDAYLVQLNAINVILMGIIIVLIVQVYST